MRPTPRLLSTRPTSAALTWRGYYDPGAGGGNQEGTPLVWNGTIYGITNWSAVFAVDASTGRERWHRDPEVNQTAVRAKIRCGLVNRGVAIYQGKITAPVIDGRLEALDAETGRPVREARVGYPQDNYAMTMAPRIAKDKVGLAGTELLIRRQFAAYDGETGKFAWRFYISPAIPPNVIERPT